MLRLGRVLKPRCMPPAYLMDETVQLLKESLRVKEVGTNTVMFNSRGKSFVLRFHQTPGVARPLRGYTVSTSADEWLLPLIKRFGLVQEPVHATTVIVKWNTGWCAPRFDPRKTPIASPKYQNGDLFLLCDVKSEPFNIRSLGRHCKWVTVLYVDVTSKGIWLELPRAMCLLPWMEV